MRKFPKNWGPLTVAIIAVAASVYAIYWDNAHFDMALKQDLSREQKADVQFETANKLAGEANELAGEAIEADKQLHDEVMEADEQHAEHAKLNVHLSRLENRLIRQGDWLNEIPDNINLPSAQQHHKDATDNWREADRGLLAGNFDRVRELIEVAHDNIDKCFSAADEEAGRLPWLADEEAGRLPPKPVWIGTEEENY